MGCQTCLLVRNDGVLGGDVRVECGFLTCIGGLRESNGTCDTLVPKLIQRILKTQTEAFAVLQVTDYIRVVCVQLGIERGRIEIESPVLVNRNS